MRYRLTGLQEFALWFTIVGWVCYVLAAVAPHGEHAGRWVFWLHDHQHLAALVLALVCVALIWLTTCLPTIVHDDELKPERFTPALVAALFGSSLVFGVMWFYVLPATQIPWMYFGLSIHGLVAITVTASASKDPQGMAYAKFAWASLPAAPAVIVGHVISMIIALVIVLACDLMQRVLGRDLPPPKPSTDPAVRQALFTQMPMPVAGQPLYMGYATGAPGAPDPAGLNIPGTYDIGALQPPLQLSGVPVTLAPDVVGLIGRPHSFGPVQMQLSSTPLPAEITIPPGGDELPGFQLTVPAGLTMADAMMMVYRLLTQQFEERGWLPPGILRQVQPDPLEGWRAWRLKQDSEGKWMLRGNQQDWTGPRFVAQCREGLESDLTPSQVSRVRAKEHLNSDRHQCGVYSTFDPETARLRGPYGGPVVIGRCSLQGVTVVGTEAQRSEVVDIDVLYLPPRQDDAADRTYLQPLAEEVRKEARDDLAARYGVPVILPDEAEWEQICANG